MAKRQMPRSQIFMKSKREKFKRQKFKMGKGQKMYKIDQDQDR